MSLSNTAWRAQNWLTTYIWGEPETRAEIKAAGRELAFALRTELGIPPINIRVDFSDETPGITLLAAKVAFLAFPADSPQLKSFESHLYSGQSISDRELIEEYEEFKQQNQ